VAYDNLGNALQDLGKPAEAAVEYREAIRLQPDFPEAHNNLGVALQALGKLSEALAEYWVAIRLRPDYFEAHLRLGAALSVQNRLSEAIGEYQEALRLQPDHPEVNCALGLAQMALGGFPEALASLRRGHELGRKLPGWRYPSDRWVQQAERPVELDAQLPGFLNGQSKPRDAAEQIELADLCNRKQLHAAAVRFFAGAFKAEPKRAADLKSFNRYKAAWSATLAGCQQGKDAAGLDDSERARLRTQARGWLRDDLAAWAQFADGGKAEALALVHQQMQHWQQDANLAGVRHPWALWRLPSEERSVWREFWADVAALQKKADGPK
jgi:tetratricopeptide (TPR) repeat protein